jgi:hypothetical protein
MGQSNQIFSSKNSQTLINATVGRKFPAQNGPAKIAYFEARFIKFRESLKES